MTVSERYHAFVMIFFKETRRCLRIWPQTLLPPVITMMLYFVIFGKIIGAKVGQVHGFSYIQYIVPGLIMLSVMMNSYINTSSSFFGNKFSRCIEEMLVSPMPNYIIILGYLSGGLFRGLLVGLLITITACLFTHLHIHHLFFLIITVILAVSFFGLLGLVNGIYAEKFDDVSWMPSFVIQPLTYLGGVFYSLHSLPLFWQNLSRMNPIFYIINAFRYAVLGVADANVPVAITVLFVFTLATYLLAVYLLKHSSRMRG